MAALNDLLLKMEHLKEELKQFSALEEVLVRDLKLGQEIEELCTEILRDKAYAVGAGLTEEERTKLTEVLAASRNRSGLDGEAEERRLSNALRRIFPILLRHFPLAATTNLSIGRDIPLEPALYDLLVLDEASQCDIASVIPILFRARRTIVVGDPLQLSHITTLAAATDKQLRTQFKLGGMEFERFSYRTSSMFELAASSPRVELRTNLRQHHRCHPEIAEYCSETFYKGGWTILTSHGKEGGLRWTHIEDDCQSAPGGGVTSENQISAILEELGRLAAEKYSGSLGVVTPFKHQANRIRDRAHQALPDSTLRQWRFLVSTADGFQGDERDLVLMSIPGGEGMPEGSKRFLSNGPNRFNVAVSRARRLLHVFADSSWALRSGVRHIEELCRSCERSAEAQLLAAQSPFRQDLVGPVWEPQLAEAMQRAGISFHQQYPACGRFLDFAIFDTSLKLNVEVDGESFHRTAWGDRKTADLDRDQALIADGWTVVRFWVYQLREDMEGCIQHIQKRMQGSGK